MESEKLIQLRSSGPGLLGPFLEESMAPYRVLDENSHTSFRILLVIGGKQKASFFGHQIIAKSISLWQLSDTCLVLDSELHHSDGGLPRILGGPTPGHHRYHLLNSDQETMCRMAYKLYSKVLSQFADLNMIFVQDMGGMAATVEFLSRWTLWADAHQERVPMVLVQDVPVSLEELHFEMTIQLLAMLRGQEPERQLSAMQIKSLITKTFCFYVASSPAQLPQLFDLADKRAQGQADRGLQLSAAHTKTLLQRGIAQFAKTPHQPLRFVHLSRKNCPVPVTIRKNVTSTILVNKNHPREVCHIIASALALDALTAGGHCFPADEVFETLYAEDILACERETKTINLHYWTRTYFLDIMLSTRMSLSVLRSQHLTNAKSWWRICRAKSATTMCMICILQTADHTLDCLHSFCERCLSRYFNNAETWSFVPPSCIICQKPNRACVQIQPPTAGTRTLQVRGRAPAKTMETFKAVQRFHGLKYIPIHEQFDHVQGKDTGIFFMLALFHERWPLQDCAYQAIRVKQCKIRRQKISFGNGLDWDLSRLKDYPGKYKISEDIASSDDANGTGSASDGITARYAGVSPLSGSIRHISSVLVASLFYVELISSPRFYSSPELCALNVLCRVPPGADLANFLSFLRRDRATLVYKCSETEARRTILCNEAVIAACTNGLPFQRPILVEAFSMEANVQVSLEFYPFLGAPLYNISHCPYRLQDLVADQGLDCPFSGAAVKKQDGLEELLCHVNSIIETLDKTR